MHRPFFACVCVVLLLLTMSPATPAAADKEHRLIMADIRMLQEQTQQLQMTLVALTDVLKTVSSRMDTKLDEQAATTRKAFADQKLLVDTVAGDLRVVREKADETNVRVTSLSQEIEALRMAIPPPSAVVAPPAFSTDPLAPPPAPGTPPPAGPAGPTSLGVSPTRALDTAMADYYAGQWALAIQGFDTYIKTFPKSDQADDAQLYIGESHFGGGKFREALTAYEKVLTDYPGSNQTPQALYKRGMAFSSLGQTPQARASFELAVKNFPDSDAGRLARQQLDRLNRKP